MTIGMTDATGIESKISINDPVGTLINNERFISAMRLFSEDPVSKVKRYAIPLVEKYGVLRVSLFDTALAETIAEMLMDRTSEHLVNNISSEVGLPKVHR